MKAQARALELFKAYSDSQLPSDGGYIVSSFLDETSSYARYEVVAYSGVKSIVLTEEGLTFQTDGNKLFVLSEPPSYAQKAHGAFPPDRQGADPAPVLRAGCPHHAQPDARSWSARSRCMTYGSFTILKPSGINFSFVFYNLPDVFDTVLKFFATTLNKEAAVPKSEAEKAAKLVVEGLKKFTIWNK